jgi:2'-deoxynucleoside 5'-phosphate N-hydrolase
MAGTTIYFSGAITGGREDVALYTRIIRALEAAGYRVFPGAVASEHVPVSGEDIDGSEIFQRDIGWIDESDVVVAEVSKPSTGVGYELAYALHQRQLPVICLWRPAYYPRCSAMVRGNPGIELISYTDGELDGMLETLVEALRIKFR